MKKLGMMKTILMMGCALALLFAAVPQPVMAANSQMNLTVGTTNDAKAGDTVTVRLVGSIIRDFRHLQQDWHMTILIWNM